MNTQTYQPPPRQARKESVAIIDRLFTEGYILRGQMAAAALCIDKTVKAMCIKEMTYSPEVLELKEKELQQKEAARLAFLNGQKAKAAREKERQDRNAQFAQAFVTAAKQILTKEEFMSIVSLMPPPPEGITSHEGR